MKTYKRVLAAIITGAMMVGLVGCGSNTASNNSNDSSGSADTAASTTAELKPVVIGASGTDGTLQENALLAQNLGYIEEELEKVGYYPDYQGFAQAGPAINEALAGDSVDIAVYGDFPAITSVSNGVDVKVIANVNTSLSYAILVNDGITSVADLAGKNICVGFGTVTYKYLIRQLEANGLTADDVNIINTNTDGPTMMESGDADATVGTFYGSMYFKQQLGSGNIIASTLEAPEFGTDFVVAARSEFLEENRDAAVAFVKALQRAYEYAVENPEDAQEALVTPSQPLEIVQQTYSDTGFSYFNPELIEDFQTKLKDSIDFMLENQLITNEVTYEDVVDESILKEALK